MSNVRTPTTAIVALLAAAAAGHVEAQIQRIEVQSAPQISHVIDTLEMATVQSVRASCENEDIAALRACTTAGACMVFRTPCFPYHCDAATRTCAASCTSTAECWSGTVCFDGRCVVQRSWCDEGVARNSAGAEEKCWPFTCDAAAGRCRERCGSSDHCQPGTLCDTAIAQCVAPY